MHETLQDMFDELERDGFRPQRNDWEGFDVATTGTQFTRARLAYEDEEINLYLFQGQVVASSASFDERFPRPALMLALLGVLAANA